MKNQKTKISDIRKLDGVEDVRLEVLRHYTMLLEASIDSMIDRDMEKRLATLEKEMVEDLSRDPPKDNQCVALKYALMESQRTERICKKRMVKLQHEFRTLNECTTKALNELGRKVTGAIEAFILDYDRERGAQSVWTNVQQCIATLESRVTVEVSNLSDQMQRNNTLLIDELAARENLLDVLTRQVAEHHPDVLVCNTATAELFKRKDQMELTVRFLSRSIQDLEATRNHLTHTSSDTRQVTDDITIRTLKEQVNALQKLGHVPLLVSRMLSLESQVQEYESKKVEILSSMTVQNDQKKVLHAKQRLLDEIQKKNEKLKGEHKKVLGSLKASQEVERVFKVREEQLQAEVIGLKKLLRYAAEKTYDSSRIPQATFMSTSTAASEVVGSPTRFSPPRPAVDPSPSPRPQKSLSPVSRESTKKTHELELRMERQRLDFEARLREAENNALLQTVAAEQSMGVVRPSPTRIVTQKELEHLLQHSKEMKRVEAENMLLRSSSQRKSSSRTESVDLVEQARRRFSQVKNRYGN